jgi:hypothetical protein
VALLPVSDKGNLKSRYEWRRARRVAALRVGPGVVLAHWQAAEVVPALGAARRGATVSGLRIRVEFTASGTARHHSASFVSGPVHGDGFASELCCGRIFTERLHRGCSGTLHRFRRVLSPLAWKACRGLIGWLRVLGPAVSGERKIPLTGLQPLLKGVSPESQIAFDQFDT